MAAHRSVAAFAGHAAEFGNTLGVTWNEAALLIAAGMAFQALAFLGGSRVLGEQVFVRVCVLVVEGAGAEWGGKRLGVTKRKASKGIKSGVSEFEQGDKGSNQTVFRCFGPRIVEKRGGWEGRREKSAAQGAAGLSGLFLEESLFLFVEIGGFDSQKPSLAKGGFVNERAVLLDFLVDGHHGSRYGRP